MIANTKAAANVNRAAGLQLKLFVVGQVSGDPAEWVEKYGWGHQLVLAYSAEQAAEMADAVTAIEVVANSPACL